MADLQKVEKDQQENQEDKISKQFNQNLSRLIAVLEGPELFKKPRLKKGEVKSIVAELYKEKREAAATSFKQRAVTLFDKKLEFDKETRRLQEEFDKKVSEKKREFSNAIQDLLKDIDGIEEIEKDYEVILKEALKTQ